MKYASISDMPRPQIETREEHAETPKIAINRVDLNFDAHNVYETLAPLGLTVAIIENCSCAAFWKYPGYPSDVRDLISRAGLGSFDGSKYHPAILHCFHLRTSRLNEALALIAQALRSRGLSDNSQIIFAAEDRAWKRFELQ